MASKAGTPSASGASSKYGAKGATGTTGTSGKSCSACKYCGPGELTLAVTALGNKIASVLPKQDLLVFNAILKQLSDVIGTIIVQRDFCAALANPTAPKQQTEKQLEEEEIIEELE